MKTLRLKFLSVGLVLSGFACASHDWQVAKFDNFNICLNSAYEWKESRIGGVLGANLQYVTGSFPYTTSGGEIATIYISLRPLVDGHGSKQESVDLNKSSFDRSLDLYVNQLDDGTEVVFASSNSEIVTGASPEQFKVTCREALHRYCTRSFQYDAIEGSYSFARDLLKNWRELEAGLEEFLSKKLAYRCS